MARQILKRAAAVLQTLDSMRALVASKIVVDAGRRAQGPGTYHWGGARQPPRPNAPLQRSLPLEPELAGGLFGDVPDQLVGDLAEGLLNESVAPGVVVRKLQRSGELLAVDGDDALGERLPREPMRVDVADEMTGRVALPETDGLEAAIDARGPPRLFEEGFASVADWRAAHIEFWTSREFRDAIGSSAFSPVDDTAVVVTWFKVIEAL